MAGMKTWARLCLIVVLLAGASLGPGLRAEAAKRVKGGPPPTGADLSVSSTGGWEPIGPGHEGNFGVVVRNDGPETATAVEATIGVTGPAIVTFVTPSWGGSCTRTNPATCSAPDLPPGGDARFTVRVTATGVGTITSEARATAIERDPDPADNVAWANIEVVPDAGLRVRSWMTPIDGAPARVTHEVENLGPADAINVRVDVTGGDGVVATRGACAPTGVRTWTCVLPRLGRSGRAQIEVAMASPSVSVPDDTYVHTGGGRSRATVTADQPDPMPDDNTSEAEAPGITTQLATCRVTCLPGP